MRDLMSKEEEREEEGGREGELDEDVGGSEADGVAPIEEENSCGGG